MDKVREFAEFLKKELPMKTNELLDTYDLLTMVYDEIYDEISSKITESMEKRDIKSAQKFISFCEVIDKFKNNINEDSSLFFDEDTINYEDDTIQDEESENCTIDSEIAHTLYDDFTYTKACGFVFKGKRYRTKNLKEVLLKLCEILAKEDKSKIISFVEDPTMKGRKITYFGYKSVIENGKVKNERINGTEIYVWINLSCNQIRNIIRRILSKYNYKCDDVKIYLKGDYKN